jgi:deoxyribonuclease-4
MPFQRREIVAYSLRTENKHPKTREIARLMVRSRVAKKEPMERTSAVGPYRRPLLGAHLSIAGGVHRALGRGEELACTVIQIFTKNASQWKGRALSAEEIEKFHSEQTRTGIEVIAHAAYLINVASPDRSLAMRSIGALREEMERAEMLGIPCVVLHPGAHSGSGEQAGIKAVIESLNVVIRDTEGFHVRLLLENTAGQGSVLGHRFEHLKHMIEGSVAPERLGVCIDTCHLFAAGYDLSRSKYDDTMERLERAVGVEKVEVLHLNDSKKGLGLRVDRHEQIGLGSLGLDPFRLIMNEPRFENTPKIIETPKQHRGVDMDPVNLRLLRSLVRAAK